MRRLTLFFTCACALALPLFLAARSNGGEAEAPAPTPAKPTADAAKPAAPAKAGEKVIGPPDVAWKDMTEDQKAHYMKLVVTPAMKKLFREFDAGSFKTFNCATCHGKQAKEHKFKMPNPEIHPLPSTPEAFQAKVKEEPSWPKWTKFMGEKVEPQMATLLGQPVFNWKKPELGGFSCKNCHTLESSKP